MPPWVLALLQLFVKPIVAALTKAKVRKRRKAEDKVSESEPPKEVDTPTDP